MKLKWLWIVPLLWLGLLALGNSSREKAFLLYHKGSYHSEKSFPPPPRREQDNQAFRALLKALQQDLPGLAEVKLEYLSQPMEETQELFLTLGQKALLDKDPSQFQKAVDLLRGLALYQRNRLDLDCQAMQELARLEQRTTGLLAQAKMMKVAFQDSPVDPAGFAGNRILSHRFLIEERVRRWERHEELSHGLFQRLYGGYLNWRRALQEFDQLDGWHRQMDAGQAVSSPSDPDFAEVYQALKHFPVPGATASQVP